MTNGLEKFTDLENKVYRVIELFKAMKLQKESLEKEILKVKVRLDEIAAENERLRSELNEFQKERDLVRTRVETILQNLDDLKLQG